MRRKSSLLFPLILLCFSAYSHAQAWSGIISPGRAVDWSSAGVSGGIPSRTSNCATLGTGGQSSTFSQSVTVAQINSAIAGCASGQTVFLNTGTYHLSASGTGIEFNNKSGVTLRGAGADQTLLVFSGSGDSCKGSGSDICLMGSDTNYWGGPSNTANWTAGYSAGATVITLSNANNLKVGNPITLDQVDNTSDNGNLYVCEIGACIESGSVPSGAQRGSNSAGWRGQQQMVTVTGCSPNCPNSGSTQVTISPGLYMPNWKSGQAPGAWWANAPISGDGVENLSIDSSNSTSASGIGFINASNSWVKGVSILNTTRNHIWLLVSNRITVRDSYFYGTENAASESYGLESYVSSDSLWENNIFQKVAAPLLYNSDCEGCVSGYNFSINDYYSPSSNWLSQQAFFHSVDEFILLEGNVGAGLYADNFHGTHDFDTLFRNRYDGYELNNGAVTGSQTNPARYHPFSRYFNTIGNVLGSTGRPHTIYQCSAASCANAYQSVFVLGTGSLSNGGGSVPDDPLVASTSMRWGNYDVVTGGARWCGNSSNPGWSSTCGNTSEIPAGISLYANSVPSSTNLPASFYHSGTPSWWPSGKPWPAIGPDVSGGNIPNVGGFANTIPAEDCYLNVMGGPANGVGNALTFNANNCYSSAPAPAPPTSLSITVN